jgi:hypothetical protein
LTPDEISPEPIGHHGREPGLALVYLDRDRRLELLEILGPAFDLSLFQTATRAGKYAQ